MCPVGFLWDGGDRLLTYTRTDARRPANIRLRPLVSLNFDSNGGHDIAVLTGTAEILDDYPAVPATPLTRCRIGPPPFVEKVEGAAGATPAKEET